MNYCSVCGNNQQDIDLAAASPKQIRCQTQSARGPGGGKMDGGSGSTGNRGRNTGENRGNDRKSLFFSHPAVDV